jgi:hypothetical protein
VGNNRGSNGLPELVARPQIDEMMAKTSSPDPLVRAVDLLAAIRMAESQSGGLITVELLRRADALTKALSQRGVAVAAAPSRR